MTTDTDQFVCPHHHDLEDKIDENAMSLAHMNGEINQKLDDIKETLHGGDKMFGTMHIRLRALEAVVFGAVALGLIYLVNNLLDTIARAGG